MSQIHYNDIGTSFRCTMKDENNAVLDISSASTLNLIFRKSNGAIVTKTATLVNDGTDGKMEYVTVSGDLDMVGPWQVQGYVVLSTGSWYSDIHDFKVWKNID